MDASNSTTVLNTDANFGGAILAINNAVISATGSVTAIDNMTAIIVLTIAKPIP